MWTTLNCKATKPCPNLAKYGNFCNKHKNSAINDPVYNQIRNFKTDICHFYSRKVRCCNIAGSCGYCLYHYPEADHRITEYTEFEEMMFTGICVDCKKSHDFKHPLVENEYNLYCSDCTGIIGNPVKCEIDCRKMYKGEFFNGLMSKQELKKKFNEYVIQYHPDKGGDSEIFIRIVREKEKLGIC